ncbi:hypothetical protein GC101_17700 [Paenibacillus sp. LMG 31459]|uniref:Uncharacterized protein n=1 Tax=Paenibacillus phytohabitans TaxID=2654978 RepID=A0ABX1YL89_9BACL|nr:hypothetical protein [Paenibacillus phytohabitans]NOU80701.1 hypothetical protein [Paenibacillus phytohabitans]
MNKTIAGHTLAIRNTKQAIDRANASGNIHEAEFLTRKILPNLEERLAECRLAAAAGAHLDVGEPTGAPAGARQQPCPG